MSASNLWNSRLVTGAMRAVRPRKTKGKLPPAVKKMARAKRGLFANKATGSGNNVSLAERRTKRTFKPNVVRATLYSETLESTIKLKCTTAALRRIDKYGGFLWRWGWGAWSSSRDGRRDGGTDPRGLALSSLLCLCPG